MTLRGVIQGLMRGSDDGGSEQSGAEGAGAHDVEAMLAENGFGDLPPEMFGQALASYADTAPMAEADALTPILTTLDAGDPSDVFAVLEEQPITPVPSPPASEPMLDPSMAGASVAAEVLDDEIPDGFGESIGTGGTGSDEMDLEDHSGDELDDTSLDDTSLDDTSLDDTALDDPFAEPDVVDDAGLGEADGFVEMFETGPEATGDDPSDLDFDA